MQAFQIATTMVMAGSLLYAALKITNAKYKVDQEYDAWRIDRIKKNRDAPFVDLSYSRFLIERKLP